MISTERLLEVASSGRRAVVLTVLDGPQLGAKALVLLDGPLAAAGGSTPAPQAEGDALTGLEELVAEARLLERPTVLLHDGVRVLADVQGARTRLVIVGAYDVAEELCALGRRLGWSSTVLDARERFATRERLPSAGAVVVGWPEPGLAELTLDATTAVVVLTHDDRFDVPALRAALRSGAFYVGAIGSRTNQQRRRPRLREAGLTDADIDRIAGPAGLDLGGETPAETAVSIVAQIIACRNGRGGLALTQTQGRIHGPPAPAAPSPALGDRPGEDGVWASRPRDR